jgi:hypothetical protein
MNDSSPLNQDLNNCPIVQFTHHTKSGLPTPFINKDNFQKAIAKI